MAYLSAFDGHTSWDALAPLVDATLHDELHVHEGTASLDKEQFVAKLQSFVENGGSMQVHKLKERSTGIAYQVTFHHPKTKAMDYPIKSFATFQDGKLVKVQRDHVRQAAAIL